MSCDTRIVEQQKQIHVWSYLVRSLYFKIWLVLGK